MGIETRNIRAYDVFGNIAIAKFSDKTSAARKKQFAGKIMTDNKAITTVLEKTGKFHGRLRKQETKWLAGVKTKEALYKENGCVFRFNVDKTYFSPRLSNERKEIAGIVKGNVLVMFAGAGPYSIVIAKNSKAEKVYSNEVNREANKYALLNIGLNNLKNRMVMLNGDVKVIANKIKRRLIVNGGIVPKYFNYIVMPRPQLNDSFLKQAFMLSKKGTIVFYYDFCMEKEKYEIVEKIKKEAEKAGRKIKILKIKTAGEIGNRRIRLRVDFKVV